MGIALMQGPALGMKGSSTVKGLGRVLGLACLVFALLGPTHLWGHALLRGLGLVAAISGLLLVADRPVPAYLGLRPSRIMLFAVLVLGLYTVAFGYSVIGREMATGWRDYADLLRPLFWGLVLIVVAGLGLSRARLAKYLCWTLMASVGFFVAAAYAGDVTGASWLASELYGGTKNVIHGITGSRLSVPFPNPNHLGYFAVTSSAYLVFFGSRSMRRFGLTLGPVITWLTGSRTAMLACLVFLAVYVSAVVWNWKGSGRRGTVVFRLAVGIVAIATLGGLAGGLALQTDRVSDVTSANVREIQELPSVEGRTEVWSTALEYSGESILVGWGPSKYAVLDVVDNQYLLWLLRNGLLGTVLIVGGASIVVSRVWRVQGDSWGRFGVAAVVLAVGVMLMTGAFLDNIRLFIHTAFVLAGMGALDSRNASGGVVTLGAQRSFGGPPETGREALV